MRRTALVCAFAVLLCAAPNAFAQGGAAQCRQPVKLPGEQRVSSLVLPKGNYRITVQETGDLTCDQARAAFKQLLAAPGGTLPADWRLDVASQTFSREDGSDTFSVGQIFPPATDDGLSWGDIQNWAVIWLPIIFLGVVAFGLVWMLRLMPRTKPQEIKPSSSGAVQWDDVAGVEESKDELREVDRVPARSEALPGAGCARAAGHPAARPARDRQDAAREGRGARVEGDLLRPVGLLVRRDVRRPRRRPHPATVPPGAQADARRGSSSTSSTPSARPAARTSPARRTKRSTSCWSSWTASRHATRSS